MAANLRFGTKNQVAVMLRRLPPFNDQVSPEVDSATQQDDTLIFLKGVGRALFDERKRCGLSQQQVAERMGVEPETVSRIENGVIAPTLVRLRQFANIYGCSLEALLTQVSDTLPDLLRGIALELDGLPARDQVHVAGQALATAKYLQGLRRRGA